ncbi:MAG: TIR domain-containing protein [Planctomycetaceae bacterium]
MSDGNTERRHVFISHHHKDDAGVDGMTKLLGNVGCEIRNSSIRALRPENQARMKNGMVSDETIRRWLRSKISWAGAVVVLIGKETHTRQWVNWEIQEAMRQGKRIVGVWEHGGTEADLPPSLKDYADAVVGWQADRILDAIDGKINNWTTPDGRELPSRTIPRIVCQ